MHESKLIFSKFPLQINSYSIIFLIGSSHKMLLWLRWTQENTHLPTTAQMFAGSLQILINFGVSDCHVVI
jgi:hypothetical protein